MEKQHAHGLPPVRTVCFTGHRVIPAQHALRLPDLLDYAITSLVERGATVFRAGGAVGFDTVAAREVIRFRIDHPDVRLVLLLPCVDQDAMWSDEQRDRYSYVLRSADEVKYVSDAYTDSCMRERNLMLAQSCDILIAYVGRSRSGSAQTVTMAQRLGRTVYNLYPSLERMLSDGE